MLSITFAVDEKERLNGNDPEAEIEEMAFQDYQRPLVKSYS